MALAFQGSAPTPTAHFPALTSKTLDGQTIALPGGLPGERTVVILGFQRSQQPMIEAWARGMHLGGSTTPWLQMPVMDTPNGFVRMIVDAGMKGAIHRDLWPHIVALYTQKARFEKEMGIASEAAVQVLVVDRQGGVLERVVGEFEPDGAARILHALRGTAE